LHPALTMEVTEMQLRPLPRAAAPRPDAPIQPGDVVIRAINDDAPADVRDIHAIGMVGSFVHGFDTLDDAIQGARQYMRIVPSKQWGDQAIAVLVDPVKGYTLLQLDSVLAGFEGTPPHQTWWSADGFQTYRPELVAVVNGFYDVIENRGPAA
jgi:hypothetical protein